MSVYRTTYPLMPGEASLLAAEAAQRLDARERGQQAAAPAAGQPGQRLDAAAERERFIRETEGAYRPQDAAARADVAPGTASGVFVVPTTPAASALAAELAKLVPGLALEGRSPAFLDAAFRVATNEPWLRQTPAELEARATFWVATETAYMSPPGSVGRR